MNRRKESRRKAYRVWKEPSRKKKKIKNKTKLLRGKVENIKIVFSIEKKYMCNKYFQIGIFDVTLLPHILYGHLQAHEGSGSQF